MAVTEPDSEAPCAAQPAGFSSRNQSPTLDVTPAAVDDVPGADAMPSKPVGVHFANMRRCPSSITRLSPMFTGMIDGTPVADIVGGVELTPERTGLDVAAPKGASLPEG